MERGAPFSHYQLTNSNSGLNLDQQSYSFPTMTRSINVGPEDKNKSVVVPQQQPRMAREQDHYMPIANVVRIMRKILPAHAKISDDTKEKVQECVTEFISLVTGEANEMCQLDQRKTITANDLLAAMTKLGFEDYVRPLDKFIQRYRDLETDRGWPLRVEQPSWVQPAFRGSGVGFNGPPTHGPIRHGLPPRGPLPHGPRLSRSGLPPRGPPPPGPYGYGMLDQSMVMGGVRYFPNGSGQDGTGGGQYYPNGSGQDGVGGGRYFPNGSGQDGTGGGGSGSSSSLNGMPFFDQYGQYK